MTARVRRTRTDWQTHVARGGRGAKWRRGHYRISSDNVRMLGRGKCCGGRANCVLCRSAAQNKDPPSGYSMSHLWESVPQVEHGGLLDRTAREISTNGNET